MRHATWLLGAMLLCACVFGCNRPPQTKEEFQAEEAKRLKPAALAHAGGGWHAIRTLRVRVYADTAFEKKEHGAREFASERIERANQVLGPELRLRLVLDDVRPLPASIPTESLDGMLAAVMELDHADDIDLVFAWTGASPVLTLSFHELGRATLLGKHVVLRAMDSAAELREFAEGLDTLSADDRSQLYQQRKRHKESALLLHEVGHALGAIHVTERDDLMHPVYDNAMQHFGASNLELMGYALDERLAAPEERDLPGLARKLIDAIERSEYQGWIPDDRKTYLGALERYLPAGAGAAPSALAPNPGPVAKTPGVASPGAGSPGTGSKEAAPDLSALAEPDRARFQELDAHLRADRLSEAYALATDLAGRYPDSFLIQSKACEIGMRLGLTHREIRRYCDRMTSLAAHPASR